MANELEKVEELVNLREFAKGSKGEYIVLQQPDVTKEALLEMANKYKGVEVTPENKKEIKEHEQLMKQTRYALQRIQKSNKDFMNKAKKAEKAFFEELIEIIEPIEKDLYDKVNAIEEAARREREAAKAAAEEAARAIEKRLQELDKEFLERLAKGSNEDDLKEYDEALEALKASFEEFNEMEFEAKKIYATYKGRRAEIVKRIEAEKLAEQQKQEAEERARKKAEHEKKVFANRRKQLEKLGYDHRGGMFIHPMYEELNLKEDKVKEADEVDWFDLLEQYPDKLKQLQDEEIQRKANDILELRNKWEALLESYKELGGVVAKFKLKKAEVPTEDKFKKLATAIEELKQKRQREKLESVKAEVVEFKDDVLGFMKEFDAKVKGKEFENPEALEILKIFIEKTSEVIDDVFGEVM